MAIYLISFPTGEMDFPPEDFPQVAHDAHQIVRDMKEAGVYVFGGGIDEDVATVRVHADGTVTEDTYPQTGGIAGGHTVIRVETRAEAEQWAARVAAACRCPQELRQFMDDPES